MNPFLFPPQPDSFPPGMMPPGMMPPGMMPPGMVVTGPPMMINGPPIGMGLMNGPPGMVITTATPVTITSEPRLTNQVSMVSGFTTNQRPMGPGPQQFSGPGMQNFPPQQMTGNFQQGGFPNQAPTGQYQVTTQQGPPQQFQQQPQGQFQQQPQQFQQQGGQFQQQPPQGQFQQQPQGQFQQQPQLFQQGGQFQQPPQQQQGQFQPQQQQAGYEQRFPPQSQSGQPQQGQFQQPQGQFQQAPQQFQQGGQFQQPPQQGQFQQQPSQQGVDPAVRQLIDRVRAEQYASKQLEVLGQGLQTVRQLTCNDAKAVVQLFKYVQDQKEAINLMVPKIVDRQNLSSVIALLQYESDREELKRKYNVV